MGKKGYEKKYTIDYLENIIALIPGHIYWKDKEGVLLGCNDEQARAIGLKSRFDIKGLTAYDTLPSSTADEVTRTDKVVIEAGRPVEAEEILDLPSGERSIWLSKKVPLYDDENNICGILGISVDITEKKELEQKIAQGNKAKSQFITDISALLRGPLTAALGAVEVLSRSEMSDKQRVCVDLIQSSIGKTMPLINRLNDYIDLEDTQLKDIRGPFILRQVFEELADEYNNQAQQKSLEFIFEYDNSLPEWVSTSAYYLIQVLQNVLGNAIKFTREGSIKFEVIKESVIDAENINVKIKITDTGQGIREDKLTKLFSLFERNLNIDESDFIEAGIDLSVSAKMVEKMGGTIEIVSKINQGTSVTITIPVLLTTPHRQVAYGEYITYLPADEKVELKRERDSLIKILILEDLPIAQQALKLMLTELYNCGVTQVYNLHDAFDQLDNQYDLIITDMSLPDGSGIDFVKKFREKHGSEIPILAITAHFTEEESDLMTSSGVDAIVPKPCTLTVLSDIIDYFVFQQREE